MNLHRLERVDLRDCPKLQSIFSLTILTSLPELRQLMVYYCEKWEGIFCEESLKNLSSFSSDVCFPKLWEIIIRACNKVKRLFSYSLASHCPSLERLYIEDCSEIEKLVDRDSGEEAAHGDRLSLLKMKDLTLISLPKLRNIFGGEFEYQLKYPHDTHKNENERARVVSKLCYLELQSLPELECIWKGPTQIISLHRLERVEVWQCPKLRSIFTLATVTSLPKLKEFEVRTCDQWEGIFCEELLQNIYVADSTICFPTLETITVTHCPKVKRLFSYSLASHCPSLKKITIYYCSQIEGVVQGYKGEQVGGHDHQKLFPQLNKLNLRALPKLREIYEGYEFIQLSGTMSIQDCPSICNIPLDNSSSELEKLWLEDLGELECIWKGPTQIISLHRLEYVTLQQCLRLRSIFTLATVTSLPKLKRIEVTGCKEWEGIFFEKSLQNIYANSTVCFPTLETIEIFDCSKVKRLFSYSLASHCPSLKKITIHDCSQTEGVVQGYEGEQVTGHHHQKLFPQLNKLNLIGLPKLREIYEGYEFTQLSGTMSIQDCPSICNIPLDNSSSDLEIIKLEN
ncbi:F-box/LRR-repeat protein 4-like [Prosopis cineraria]|uniref:F-box/LRR-repeat protein 4-like n=1 Tax=Prosopis cineraria TaxID=364024 RepID=UPI00240EEEBB|nr:F-box/LRR-repeat protein 4-like [Prosopis cineraria]XP_054818500.1 F-box/LRR-repeat protein 4-like [Prosopis cineraria]XP_054818501.1 F-box/LRR-repeat protein 4-like [Prosopis cineraria]XP_054818502.1 F-box/LRR-repeat protein 4-like [Prosopis cineraria]XP_054818503.1 F-box/LRR-repeat protein 4-like [Prosopis cineraria]